jgi:hypothetical protein
VPVVLENVWWGFTPASMHILGEGFNLLSDGVLDSSTVVLMSCEAMISLIRMSATCLELEVNNHGVV